MSRACFLSPPELQRIDIACHPFWSMWGHSLYLVGSANERPDYRDIDLRLILPDDRYAALGTDEQIRLLNLAVSALIGQMCNPPKPIDFQFQPVSEANGGEHDGKARNPMGLRWIPLRRAVEERQDELTDAILDHAASKENPDA